MKRSLLPLFGLIFLTGCQTMSGRPAVKPLQTTDGVSIAYEARGQGETTLVFLHCWCGDRTFWRNQMDEFAKDYRVVAIDLPGHGQSGKNRETWTVAKYGEDVGGVIDQLDLKRVILIGHSLGGPIALEAARLRPGRVIGVVAVDTLQDAEMEYPMEAIEQIALRFDKDFEGTMDEMIRAMFPPEANAEIVEFVLATAKASDPKMATALLRDIRNRNDKAAFKAAGVPIRAINAVPHPPRGMKTTIEANRQYADFDAVLIDGVGHYPQLEKPAEFNSLLRETVQKLAAR